MVASEDDIFFDSAVNLQNRPAAFVFIWNKVFDADFRLFVDMIGDVRQAAVLYHPARIASAKVG